MNTLFSPIDNFSATNHNIAATQEIYSGHKRNRSSKVTTGGVLSANHSSQLGTSCGARGISACEAVFKPAPFAVSANEYCAAALESPRRNLFPFKHSDAALECLGDIERLVRSESRQIFAL